MFNMGFSEIAVIAVIALIFIGPKQLPEVARVVGRLLNEFKRATGDITGSFVKMRDDADQALRQTKDDLLNQISEPTSHSTSKAQQPFSEIEDSTEKISTEDDIVEPMKQDDSFTPEPTEMAQKKRKAAKKAQKKDPRNV